MNYQENNIQLSRDVLEEILPRVLKKLNIEPKAFAQAVLDTGDEIQNEYTDKGKHSLGFILDVETDGSELCRVVDPKGEY